MKIKYHLFSLLFLELLHFSCVAQSIEIAAGQNFIPGDFVSLRYESSPDYVLNWSVKGFAQRAHSHSLSYSAYGLDFLVMVPLRMLRLGAGPTMQLEQEPWVYAGWDFSKRFNLGVTGEAGIQLDISQNISLTLTAQQKYLFNSALGNSGFICAFGFKYSFDN